MNHPLRPTIKELTAKILEADYTGGKPPLKSYLKAIQGRDLFAFSWFSKTLNKKMYLKFALKNDRFYYVSLHEDKP